MKSANRKFASVFFPAACAFVLITACAAMASQPEEWTKTFTIANRPDLRIETTDASIHVDTWDQKTIEVRVYSQKWGIGQGAIEVVDHQNGDSVEINVRFPHGVHILSVGDRKVVIDVHMPREGKARLHTGDGQVHVTGLKGEMDIETGDGHAVIEDADGRLRVHTGDGRINASGRFDSLQLETGDGRIEADAAAGSTIGAGWGLHTGDGSVQLALPESFAADLALRTGDGHITLDMPVTVEGRYDSNRVGGKMNGGGGPLKIETGDGSIRIMRSGTAL